MSIADIIDWDLDAVASAVDAVGKRADSAAQYSSAVKTAPALQPSAWTGQGGDSARALAEAHTEHTDRIAGQARTLVGPLQDYLSIGQTLKATAQALQAEAQAHSFVIQPDGSVVPTGPQTGLYTKTIAQQLADKTARLLQQDDQLHQSLAQAIHGVMGPSYPVAARADVADDSRTSAGAVIPDRAYATLEKIDAGTWPASGTPGTKGGTNWTNWERTLPLTDAQGNPVSYTEWDVNNKIPGHNRDAERIVTGSDGSAWYTGDHYQTFTRMR
jgi:guanyl-specific ribonuclease Sa